MFNVLSKIGLAGVDSKESHKARIGEKIFHVILTLIAIWLLIQWGLEGVVILSPSFIEKSNWLVWFLLFLEFQTLVLLVQNKRQFIMRNWFSLFIVIICFPPVLFHSSIIVTVRILRFFILLRIVAPTYKTLKDIFIFNSLGYILLGALGITVFSGLLISVLDPAVRTPWDGIWWAWETVTTVGYGDVAPTTVSGRLVAIIVMIFGSTLFSILTANLAAYLISKSKAAKDIHAVKREEDELFKKLSAIQDQLIEIKQKVEKLEQTQQR